MAPKVREIIRRLEKDGWKHVRTTGNHRHFRHPTKPGTVTVPGKPNDPGAGGYVEQHPEAGGMATVAPALSCAVVNEWADTNYSAYLPDLPGCITTGAMVEETIASMDEVITEHLAVMRDYSDPIPETRTRVAVIEVETGVVAKSDAVQR